jgi:hypothetical protein
MCYSGTISFSEYMVNYIYEEKSKAYEKEDYDWSKLDDLDGEIVQPVVNEKDEAAIKKIKEKF